MKQERRKWLDLIGRYSDGLITTTELAALEAELRQNPELRREFIEYLNLDVTLKDSAAEFVLERPKLVETNKADKIEWTDHWFVHALASIWRQPIWARAAVMLLVAVALGGVWLARPAGRGVSARILSVQDAQVINRQLALHPGRSTKLDRLELAAGNVSLRLDSDVQVDFTGPVDVQFLSPMRLLLNRGQLRAQIGSERGKGFTVETVRGKVVDLGTAFGVTVSPVGGMDVVVFKGSVQVYGKESENDQGEGTLLSILKAGEGMRMARPQSVGPVPCVFLSSNNWTTTAPDESTIVSVKDRLSGSATNRFYRVWVGGMKPGVPARHGGWYKWIPTDGGQFPDWLQKADLVETFTRDKLADDFELSLELAKSAVVYIFLDTRHGPPKWLRDQFTDTGEQIQLLYFDPEKHSLTNSVTELERTPFAVWKSKPLPPGQFVLGPRRQPAKFRAGEMYGVAVKAEP